MKIKIENEDLVSEDIRALLEINLTALNKRIEDLDGSDLMPMSFLASTNSAENPKVIAHPFEDEPSKDATASFIKQEASRMGADLYLFTSESWGMKPEDQDEFLKGIEEGKYKFIEDYEKRITVLTVVFETLKGQWFCFQPYDNKPLEEFDFIKGKLGGRFSNVIKHVSLG